MKALYNFQDSLSAIVDALNARKNLSTPDEKDAIDNEILKLVSTTLNSMSVTYENRLRDLEDIIEEYKEEETDFDFRKGWDKDITRITIILYIVKSREAIGKCGYCNTFKERGYIDKLRNLWKELNIIEHKYRFRIVYVDPVDRMFNSRTSPYYTSKLTEEGENFYVSKAEFMRTYPSVIIKVKFKQGKVAKKEQLWEMVEGLGTVREGGKTKIIYSAITERIKLFLKDNDEKHLQGMVKHKGQEHYVDYIKDRTK